MPVRALVLRTAGTNCDFETQFAWEQAGAHADRIHINRLIENPKTLARFWRTPLTPVAHGQSRSTPLAGACARAYRASAGGSIPAAAPAAAASCRCRQRQRGQAG